MNTTNHANMPISANLLAVADALVDAGNLEVLHALHGALTKLILGDIAHESISLVEINEYISEALSLLEGGRTPEEVKVSSIRGLIDE